MYIIVCGGGKVGYYLAKELIEADHEVLVIERDAARCDLIADELGDIVLKGDACEAVVLEEAGTARADILIAVTGDDEDNLVSSQVAKHRFHVLRTVARINNPKNESIFLALGIDSTVSATTAVLTAIEHRLPTHPLIPLLTLRNGGFEIVEVSIPEDASAVGKRVGDVPLPPHSIIALVVSEQGEPHIPTANTVLRANDDLVAVTLRDNEEALRYVLTGAPARAR